MTWRWREDANGDAAIRTHWQNLNEDRIGKVKGWPWHGRAWLHVRNESARIEWNLRSTSCGIALQTSQDGEDTISGSIALPPLALYFGVDLNKGRLLHRLASWVSRKSSDMGGSKSYSGSQLSIRIFDWAVWWNIFSDDSGWTSTRPRWRDGNWHVLNTLLGKERYFEDSEAVSEDVLVPMPEGSYRGKVTLRSDSWKRPRWFRKVVTRAHIEMVDPVPIPGKGENSYDCDEDAIHGTTAPAKSVDEAVAGVVASALRTRRKYGGQDWRPESKASAAEGTT